MSKQRGIASIKRGLARTNRAADRTYYTLAESVDGRWAVAFGDYDKQTVMDEREDMLDADITGQSFKRRAQRLKVIITTTSDQAEINAAIARLNA